MKTRTLFLLPVIALVGFLAIKPPAVGTTTSPGLDIESQETEMPAKVTSPAPKGSTSGGDQEVPSGSLKAPSAVAPATEMANTPQLLPPNSSTAPIAPPVIPGDDDDDDDDDDDHHRGHHDDDDKDDDDDDKDDDDD